MGWCIWFVCRGTSWQSSDSDWMNNPIGLCRWLLRSDWRPFCWVLCRMDSLHVPRPTDRVSSYPTAASMTCRCDNCSQIGPAKYHRAKRCCSWCVGKARLLWRWIMSLGNQQPSFNGWGNPNQLQMPLRRSFGWGNSLGCHISTLGAWCSPRWNPWCLSRWCSELLCRSFPTVCHAPAGSCRVDASYFLWLKPSAYLHYRRGLPLVHTYSQTVHDETWH